MKPGTLQHRAEAQMPSFPQDPQKPVIDGKAASHDVMIGWLAYKEAKSVLYGPESQNHQTVRPRPASFKRIAQPEIDVCALFPRRLFLPLG